VPTDQLTFEGSKPPRTPGVGTASWKVLQMLRADPWVCGTSLSNEVGCAFGSRLSELRAAGWWLEKRKCRNPTHRHRAALYEYGIVAAERGPDG
jgi:hypothetical protein